MQKFSITALTGAEFVPDTDILALTLNTLRDGPIQLGLPSKAVQSLAVLFLCFLACRGVIHSPFGLALRGIRENATRMPAIGAPTLSHLRKAYTIAAVVAGLAGAALTHTTSTVSLEVLSFGRSADVLVILILGGAGRLYGGIVGAIIYMVARDQFSGINPQYWYFWIGLLLVAVVMFLPNGILGGLSRFLRQRS